MYVLSSETRKKKEKQFLLVNRLVVPGLTALSKILCVKSLCAFFLPELKLFFPRTFLLQFWKLPKVFREQERDKGHSGAVSAQS